MTTHDFFCSTLSQQAAEPLYGSAPEKRIWLLLEYNQPWAAQAFPESDLPQLVKAHLADYLARTPEANILLIRQPERSSSRLQFYVANVQAEAPALYAYELAHYEDLLAIDLDAAVAGQNSAATDPEPLFLVCTNARRDRCCGRYGPALYRELSRHAGTRVWQSSHFGGHRFAPTALFLPEGVCYGRIPAEQASALVVAHQEKRIVLEYLRGRVAYPGPVQAADYLLRQRLNLTGFSDLRLIQAQADTPDLWDVCFATAAEEYEIRLEKYQTDTMIYTSCSDSKQAAVAGFRLL
jgi:hypothetical protein